MAADIDSDIESAEEADAILTDLAEALEREAGDISVAIEQIRDATQVDDDGNIELPDDMTLPFYEEQRELAFAIGLTVGAVLEAKERAVEGDDDSEDTQTETAQTVEQEQSVTVTA